MFRIRRRSRSFRNLSRLAAEVEFFRKRILPSANPLLGVVADLGEIQIQNFDNGVIPRPIAFSNGPGTTTVLIESATTQEQLDFAPGPEQEIIVIGNGDVSDPMIIDQANLHAVFLTEINGERHAAGSGVSQDGQIRPILVNLVTNEVTEIDHPSGLANDSSSLFNIGGSHVAISNGGPLFSTNSLTGNTVPLEFVVFANNQSVGTIFTSNDGLFIGSESSTDIGFVAWDATTGSQLTQFVTPTVVTSSNPLVQVTNGIVETTGVFGANDSREAVAGFEVVGTTFDFATFSGTEKREIGFFSLETGELIADQSFPGFDALTTDVNDQLLTVYTAIVGDPVVDLFGPPPVTELRVNMWDGTSFEDQPLAEILAANGITTNFSGYEVVGLHSTPDANGDIRVSILLTLEDQNGDVINTQLVSLTYAGPVVQTLDIDGDGVANAATDGIIAVRHYFGFTGQPLIEGLGVSVSVEEVEAALAASTFLDVDGNGIIDAATDGVLGIRYLFGFNGDALANGAIGENATRTTGEEVHAFLSGFMPTGQAAPVFSGEPLEYASSDPVLVSLLVNAGVIVPPETGNGEENGGETDPGTGEENGGETDPGTGEETGNSGGSNGPDVIFGPFPPDPTVSDPTDPGNSDPGIPVGPEVPDPPVAEEPAGEPVTPEDPVLEGDDDPAEEEPVVLPNIFGVIDNAFGQPSIFDDFNGQTLEFSLPREDRVIVEQNEDTTPPPRDLDVPTTEMSEETRRFFEAVATASRFLGDMAGMSEAQLRAELLGMANLGLIDESLVDSLVSYFSNVATRPRRDPNVVPASGEERPAAKTAADVDKNQRSDAAEVQDANNPGVIEAALEEVVEALVGAGNE